MSARQRGRLAREARREVLRGEYAGSIPFDELRVRDRVMWRCVEHGVFEAQLQHRLYNGSDCTECDRGGRPTQASAARRGKLRAEYRGTKPYDLLRVTDETMWECAAGHRWTASLLRRYDGAGCPECVRPRPRGATAQARLDALRDEYRGTVPLDNVTSETRVPWQCRTCGHCWHAPLTRRLHSGSGCPECANVSRRRALAARRGVL